MIIQVYRGRFRSLRIEVPTHIVFFVTSEGVIIHALVFGLIYTDERGPRSEVKTLIDLEFLSDAQILHDFNRFHPPDEERPLGEESVFILVFDSVHSKQLIVEL